MWTEDPSKSAMTKGDGVDPFIAPEEIAARMLELCENEVYGDGTILEVTKGKTRVVPMYHSPPPSGEGTLMPGYQDAQLNLYETLKRDGLKV
jgi:hypothetical protein